MTGSRREVRAAARRRRARRGAGISALSSVVVLGGLAAARSSPAPAGTPSSETFFSWDDFKRSFPAVLDGFWLDVKLFVIVEVVVLVLALVVALTRTTRAPALFPLRLLATVYTDVMRGIPTILLVYLVGFGVPALELSGPADRPGGARRRRAGALLRRLRRRGLPRGDRLRAPEPARRGARRRAHGRRRRCATSCCPQAVRRVVPPLLNDFIALQKDVALVSILGVIEAFRVAQIDASSNFNYTPLVAAALLYLCVTIPLARVVDHMQAGTRRARGGAEVAPA